jgi:hypothetical protein
MKFSKLLLATVLVGLVGFAGYYLIKRQVQPNLAAKLTGEIEKVTADSNLQSVDISSLTDFQWDRLYIFAPYSTPEDINKSLGFTWPEAASSDITLHDHINLLVFVRGNEVVEHVEFLRAKGDFSGAASVEAYTPDQASFLVDDADGMKILVPSLPSASQNQ